MATGYPAVHERLPSPLEQNALRAHRRRLLERASGRVVEVGGGIGEHLALYRPEQVDEVVVVGPDPWARPFLERRVGEARVPVTVVDGPLPAGLEPGSIDTVVFAFLLCSLPDRHGLLSGVDQVMGPDGRLLFIEHVPGRLNRGLLGDLASPVWRAATTGCDLKSDPVASIRGAGFTIIDLERFTMPTLQIPIRSCVAGVARSSRRPGATR